MSLPAILDLYRYNDWANARVTASVLSLDLKAFARHLGGSHPTIRDAFAHIAGTEWAWLQRWLGTSPAAPPEWYGSTDAAQIAKEWRDVEERRRAFLGRLSEAALDTKCSFLYMSGRPGSHALRDLLFHVVNHSTFHRGQVVSMLREVGNPAMPTDYVVFREEQ